MTLGELVSLLMRSCEQLVERGQRDGELLLLYDGLATLEGYFAARGLLDDQVN